MTQNFSHVISARFVVSRCLGLSPMVAVLALVTLLSALPASHAKAANIIVEASGDVSLTDGLCTLREALINANSNIALFPDCAGGTGPADTITFTAAVSGVPILPLSALPPITADLTVDGGGKDITIFGNNSRPFTINSGTVELKGLKITGGTWPEGGGIYNQGTLTLTGCTVSGNVADSGGGIFNKGTLILNNSSVTANNADNGGGIFNLSGRVTVTASQIDGNTASEDGGGIWSDTSGGEITRVIDSTVSNNVADNRGGGIAHGLGGQEATLLVSNSTIRNNKADYGGGLHGDHGTMTVNGGSVIRNNEAFVSGGGIHSELVGKVYLWINTATISSNKAPLGGGVSTEFVADLKSVTISDNYADSGGGIYSSYVREFQGNIGCHGGNGKLGITNSIIRNNTASDEGGGLYTEGTAVNINSATIKDNTAGSSGGGIWNSETGGFWYDCGDLYIIYSTISGNRALAGDGGGIWNDQYGFLDLHTSTVSGNTSGGDGGGIWNDYVSKIYSATISENIASDEGGGIYGTGALLEVTNSIIAANLAGLAADCRAQLTGLSVNLVSDPSGCTFLGIYPLIDDPMLGALADNGGSTRTHSLSANSPAIDAGHYANQEQCLSIPYYIPDVVDQRGLKRPQSLHCDIGAYERPLFWVRPSVGRGQGVFFPAEAQKVDPGNTTQYTLTPIPHSVEGTCGGSLNGNVYTTNAVNADCTVIAHFAAAAYTVSPSTGAGGSISPSADALIDYGTNARFVLIPDPGFEVNEVGGSCGGSLVKVDELGGICSGGLGEGGATYRTDAVSADCTVIASFTEKTGGVFASGFEGEITRYQVGDIGPGGGIVFHVTDGGLHGLEAAPVDQDDGAGAPWGCQDVVITPDGETAGTGIGTGLENTGNIILGCPEPGIAARLADAYCLGRFNDWYLPSTGELSAMYTNLHADGLGNFIVINKADYWSSTENGTRGIDAQYVYFVNGIQSYQPKGQQKRVRAIRAF